MHLSFSTSCKHACNTDHHRSFCRVRIEDSIGHRSNPAMHGKNQGVNRTVCVCARERERERRGGKICLCEVANCCLAASAWPECTQVNVSWSEHCERVLQNSATLWQLNCSCQHFLCAFVRCVCLNLCSAGIEKVKKVVNVVSHNPLVGQLQQLVSNFHDAPMLLVAVLNHLSCKKPRV